MRNIKAKDTHRKFSFVRCCIVSVRLVRIDSWDDPFDDGLLSGIILF
jgi:hypothetical protein